MSSISPTPDATTIETREPVILPLASPPLRDYSPDERITGVNADGLISIYGWCAPWCGQAIDRGEERGRSVADHGLWCTTTLGAWVDAQREDGTREVVGVELAHPYEHGIYTTPRRLREDVVRLVIGADRDHDDERTEVHMTSSAARTLAATLLYAADALEGVDRPVRRTR